MDQLRLSIITMLAIIASSLSMAQGFIDPSGYKYYYKIGISNPKTGEDVEICDPENPYFFEKNTERVNDKEYHIMNISKSNHNSKKPRGKLYIRWEEGKYYLLLTEDIVNFLFSTVDWDYAQLLTDAPMIGKEVLLYDFSSPVGSEYSTVTSDSYDYWDFECYIEDTKITSKNLVNIKGIIRRQYHCNLSTYYPYFIEGIGSPIGYFYSIIVDSIDRNKAFYAYLDYVEDEEGNIIYSVDDRDFATPPYNPDGIMQVYDSIDMENTTFDLSGRKICNPTKGSIYIKNGELLIAH